MLGEHVQVRVVTYHRDVGDLPPEPVADLVFAWNDARAAPEHCVPVLDEAVGPVCAPVYADAHAEALNGPVAGWGA